MTKSQTLYYQYLDSPIGVVEITANNDSVQSIYFVEQPVSDRPTNAITTLAAQQLSAYFLGQLDTFTLPLNAAGTVFQKKVWQQLSCIPYGSTCSYADIAGAINNPKAVRAVGAANGKNPISIVVPCHRVIGASGKLTGYAGGLERKSWLLALEQNQGQL